MIKTKKHTCEKLRKHQKEKDVTIEKSNTIWFWVFWGEKSCCSHKVDYCPYCGEKLEKEEDHARKNN